MTTTPPPAATAAAPPPVGGARPPGQPVGAPAAPPPAAGARATQPARGRHPGPAGRRWAPRCGRPWPAPRGGCGPWASSASSPTLLFGLAAGQAFRSADGALERAAANSDQLVRIQAIQTNVVQADADATNAFLVGGLEPAAQRADYTEAIASASRLIAEAAQHQPADGDALGALNQSLVAYTSQVEQARANNRQALPIGAQYLKDASADLRADALPLLKNLGEANDARVAEEFDRAGTGRAVARRRRACSPCSCSVLALVWLARRTRRYVNLPLAAAALVVLVTMVVGTVGLLAVKGDVDTTRDGVYAATLSTAQARIAGFDAKSNESLTLIARGSGAAFEKAWQASSTAVNAELTELDAEPGVLRPEPAAVVGLRRRSTRRSARSTTAATGRGRSRSPRARARLGQRHLRRVRHQLRGAAGRPERPDRPAARRHRRLAAVRRGARAAGRRGRGACAPGGASRCGWRSTG